MTYNEVKAGGPFAYPDHNIDPADKGEKYCMEYARAAYQDWETGYAKGVFYNNAGDYQRYKLYAFGKQPIDPYKPRLGITKDRGNETYLNISWKVRPIISLYRHRAISRLMKNEYGVVATPVDALAKSEAQGAYQKAKTKIVMRELATQADPAMANHPALKAQPGEAMDVEELDMRVEFGESFNRSKDAELAIQLAFYENKDKEFRYSLFEDLFDLGVAGYKEWLGEDNKPKFRKVNPENVIISFCNNRDFSDAVHAGEVIYVDLVYLATVRNADGSPKFTEDQLIQLATDVAGKYGNPRMLSAGTAGTKMYSKFKVPVFDMEFKTYDRHNYRMAVNDAGNLTFRKADLKRGKTSDKYQSRTYEMIYKCKWIIGTDYCYDAGKAYDQKRSVDPAKKAKTSLSYKFYAYDFYQMMASGMMEKLIPWIDDYQLTVYRIENCIAQAIPNGYWIDLDAIDNVAMAHGGEGNSGEEILDFFTERGILQGRSKNIDGSSQSYKPIIPLTNTTASELEGYWSHLIAIVSQIEKITGFNTITSGNPNPKTLNKGYEIADESTDDALFQLQKAETYLIEQLANDVMCRTQQGLRKGGIEGYLPAINSNTLRFITLDGDLPLRDYGVMLEEKSTYEQKQFLLQTMADDIRQGFLDTSDAMFILNTYNIKQAQMIMAYRVKRNKQIMQQNQLQLAQQNAQAQQESAMVTAQQDKEKMQMEYDLRLREEMAKLEGQVRLKEMELQQKYQASAEAASAKITTAQVNNEGKIAVEAMRPPPAPATSKSK